MSAFTLKLIALAAMILDHMSVAMPETFDFGYRVIGRLAFPLFVFLVAEGFAHTKSRMKFLTRLFAFAIISQPFFGWALHGAAMPGEVSFVAHTNIYYTLFLGGLAVTWYAFLHEIMKKYESVIACNYNDALSPISDRFLMLLRFNGQHSGMRTRVVLEMAVMGGYKLGFMLFIYGPMVGFAWIAHLLNTDYGAYGVVFIFTAYWMRERNRVIKLTTFALLSLWQFRWLFNGAIEFGFAAFEPIVWLMIPATLVSTVLIAFYNGRRGLGMKWLFYIAYPAHLAVLAAFVTFL